MVLSGPLWPSFADSLPIYKLNCGCGPIIGFSNKLLYGQIKFT